MDNISHSMVGLGLGELVHRSLAPETDPHQHRLRRRLLLFTAFTASNFPDLDLLLTSLLPHPLGYLLHHRGHTHTLLFLPPQLLVLAGAIWLLWPAARRLLRASAPARTGSALTAVLGMALHLAMDFLNSYGLHPFYPLDSRWFYGDTIFIIEPLFWVVLGVAMALTVQTRWLRFALIALLLALPVWFCSKGYLALTAVFALGVFAITLMAFAHRDGAQGRSALSVAFGICIGFIVVQAAASTRARQQVTATVDPQSSHRLLDAAMTPFPTHPLCWVYASIESNQAAGIYRLRRGILSLAPAILPVGACPRRFAERALEPAAAAPRSTPATDAMMLVFEQTASLAELRTRERENCYFRAWLRFARVPLLVGNEASDARYGTLKRANFTTFRLDDVAGQACPSSVPPWDYPRADLLRRD
jgi:inner membrane protein